MGDRKYWEEDYRGAVEHYFTVFQMGYKYAVLQAAYTYLSGKIGSKQRSRERK